MGFLQLTGTALSAAWVGTTLMGCGERPNPAPAPYAPGSIQDAWNNHFEAFGEQDLDKIMMDYDDASVLEVWNQACTQSTLFALSTYTGTTAIRGFFSSLFSRIADTSKLVVPSFNVGGDVNPVVEPSTGPVDVNSHVFLVWSSPDDGIGLTTDTFLWKDGYKIMKQNIVTHELAQCAGAATAGTERRLSAAQNITNGWNNHFQAFGNKDLNQIMLDYIDTSVIRVFDGNGNVYSKHSGSTEIRAMFNSLFSAIANAAWGGSEGILVPLQKIETEYRSVFLVWQSYSHPLATDTFLFDDNGKIVVQNIVVTTNSTNLAEALV